MPKKKTTEKTASLNPEQFSEGGGLLDDVDVTVEEARFDLFDYGGKVKPGVPAMRLELDSEEGTYTEYLSMGNKNDWMPSDDGCCLVAIGKATSINMSSKGGIFLKSLVDAGYPADELGDDLSVIDGLQAHVIRVPAPKYNIRGKEKNEREDTILTISEILAMPGEKKAKPKTKPTGKAKAKAKPKAKPKDKAADEDLTDAATAAIMEVLSEEDSFPVAKLPLKLYAVLKDDPAKKEIVKVAFDEDFMNSGPWTLEDGTISMG